MGEDDAGEGKRTSFESRPSGPTVGGRRRPRGQSCLLGRTPLSIATEEVAQAVRRVREIAALGVAEMVVHDAARRMISDRA